jgi:hypothetical protein
MRRSTGWALGVCAKLRNEAPPYPPWFSAAVPRAFCRQQQNRGDDYVGAPTGTAQALAAQLNGSVPPLHGCPAPQ